MRKLPVLLMLGVLASACVAPVKKEAYNPFGKSLRTANSKKVKLALVFPKLVVKGEKAKYADPLKARSKSDPDKMYRGALAIYYSHFKQVTMVKSANDSRAADADLIGEVKVTLTKAKKPSLEFKTLFYTQEHNLVATVNTVIEGKASVFVPKRADKLMKELLPQIPDKLGPALKGSGELQSHSGTLGGAMASRRRDAQPKAFDSDVDRPAYTFSENANNFALVIGIDSYQNLPSAEYAGRDAVAVRAHLRALGYPSKNTVLLLDSQATGNAMKSYLESWLPRKVTPESKVFVYFSGHGAPDVESGQAFLVPWDGDPQFLTDTGYPLKRFYEKLNALKAKEIVVAMDSCFSGAGGKSVIAKGARPLVTKINTETASMGKITVLSAAGGDEITGGEDSQGHGLFTYYFLKGLNDSSGKDSVGKIYKYLKPKVSAAARRANRGQTPQLMGADASRAAVQSLR